MMDKLGDLKEHIINFWKGLNLLKKTSILLGVVSIMIVVLLTTYFYKKTDYTTLFSDLNDEESGLIVKELDEKKIKYKLEDKSSKILIDSSQIDKFRINLAVDNKLPHSSTGFEIFDNTSMMATDEDRKIMYQRAVTGELQKSIESLDGVKSAKVLLMTPDKSIFENNDKEASASIILKLKSDFSLSDSTVKGIAALTSGAVENLTIKNIKIVDDKGNVLSEGLNEDNQFNSTDLTNKIQTLKIEYEKNLEEKTTSLLSTVFEKSKFKLVVNADLDFDSVEKKIVTYGDTKIRSENVQATGDRIDQQEVQGGTIDDNVSNVVGTNNNNNKTFNKSTNNEVDTETTTILNAPGMVRKIGASILVNDNLSVVETEKIEKVIQSAIGFDKDRGDTISVQGMLIDEGNDVKNNPDDVKKEKFLSRKTFGKKIVWFGLITIVILILLLILILKLKRKSESDEFDEFDEFDSLIDVSEEASSESEIESELYLNSVSEIDSNEEFQDVVKEIESLEKLRIEEISKTQEQEEKRLLQKTHDREVEAKKYAKNNPNLAAELIKVWMKDK